ncbi:TetR family transcriptional regulator [Ideonella sp. B508-1]|uniref:TetR family transcriptional regulator n=1 Tax=Ideonella sp. B508-1 TaxID=137716 RepID=UPI0003461ED2|nr:TetR family transcriptional regulator [Ideonella sp. B508-1]
MARRTKEDALATRHRILDAAEQVFESQGVARTSLQQVAATAGVTRGAIYWHFKDKAELFSAMMDRVLLPCEWAVDDAELIEEEADPLAAVIALALAPLEQLSTDERLRRVFMIAMHFTEYTDEMSQVLTRCDESVGRYIAEIDRLLRQAMRRGLLPANLDSRAQATALFAMVDGLMHNWTRRPTAFALLPVARNGVQSFLRGLAQSTG